MEYYHTELRGKADGRTQCRPERRSMSQGERNITPEEAMDLLVGLMQNYFSSTADKESLRKMAQERGIQIEDDEPEEQTRKKILDLEEYQGTESLTVPPSREEQEEQQLPRQGVFMIKARRCKRCGRLLTSPQAVDLGYGCQCAAKAREEKREREPLPGQMSILDYFKQEGEE